MLKVQDGWLWVGVGIFWIIAVRGIAYGLEAVIESSETHVSIQSPTSQAPSSKPSKKGTAADTIPIKSLLTLARSTNVDIASAATTLLCDRFYRSPSCMRALSIDLISTDALVRQRATKTRCMLEENVLDGEPLFVPTPRHDDGITDGTHFTDDEFIALPPLPSLPSPRSRPHEESEEEQALRRRRREAMVFNEGDRPLSREDILMASIAATGSEARDQGLPDGRDVAAMNDFIHAIPHLP